MTRRAEVRLRTAEAPQATALHALIEANRVEGRLLPRTVEDVRAHADRFVVALVSRRIAGCAELAPLSPQLAEVRSLAVDARFRDRGVGTLLVRELGRRARRAGYDRLCAFTHEPAYFSRMGFSIVPHLWLSEKVFTDCAACPLFQRCGQYGMLLPLEPELELPEAPAASLHRA